jgi:hypothetical protein
VAGYPTWKRTSIERSIDGGAGRRVRRPLHEFAGALGCVAPGMASGPMRIMNMMRIEHFGAARTCHPRPPARGFGEQTEVD